MKLSRFRATNIGRIESMDVEIPAAGAVVLGCNESGKSTMVNAIEAALEARGVGKDDRAKLLRRGTERGEIVLDLDGVEGAVTVTRRLSPKSTSVTVKNAAGEEPAGGPQTWLEKHVLGTMPIDPCRFFLADLPEQKRMVLEALPLTVDRELEQRFFPGLKDGLVDRSGHGLDVVGRYHKLFDDLRYKENRAVEAAAAAVQQRTAELKSTAAEPVPARPTVAEALAAQEARRVEASRLEQQDEIARGAEGRLAGERDAISQEREAIERAAAEAASLGVPAAEASIATKDVERALEAFDIVEAEIAKIEKALDNARTRRAVARQQLDHAERAAREINARSQRATVAVERVVARQEALAARERSLANAAVPRVDPAALARARASVAQADAAVAIARRAEAAQVARKALEDAKAAHAAAVAKAGKLDGYVKATAKMREALLEKTGIPGLEVRDDDLLLNGTSFSRLSGSQRVKFATDLAKLAITSSGDPRRFLLLDDIERVQADDRAEFFAHAIAGGWQALMFRVATREEVAKHGCRPDELVVCCFEEDLGRPLPAAGAPGAAKASAHASNAGGLFDAHSG